MFGSLDLGSVPCKTVTVVKWDKSMTTKHLALHVVFVLLSGQCPWSTDLIHGQELSQPVTDLYDRLKAASVEVLVDRRLAGSGCVIDRKGFVLTAGHVVANAETKIEAISSRAGRLNAEVVAIDHGHDLALLKLEECADGYAPLELAEAPPSAGRTVYLFGAPLFRHGVLIKGTVARNDTTFEFVDGRYVEVLHICAPVAKGLSGGPWVNESGKVFGVQSSIMSLGDSQQGISFASPLPAIRRLAQVRISPQTPTLGLGVEEIWEQSPDYLKNLHDDVEGLVIRVVNENGPAQKGGIQVSWVITSIDGRAIQYRDDLLRIIRSKNVGETVKLVTIDASGRHQKEWPLVLEALGNK
jgi:serine protease Do